MSDMHPRDVDEFCKNITFNMVSNKPVYVVRHKGDIVSLGKKNGRFNAPGHARLSLNRYVKICLYRFVADMKRNGHLLNEDPREYGMDYYQQCVDELLNRGTLVIEKV